MLTGALLTSCCPAPSASLTPPGAPASAFRADVVGASLDAGLLHVRLSPGGPLTSVSVVGVPLRAADGTPLPLSAFEAGGLQVYLTGDADVQVQAVQVIGAR